jgi:chromosome segregation ATPase
MWKFFKKRKMELEQLQQENEQLKAAIAGLNFNLQLADKNNTNLRNELERYSKQIKDLEAEVKHLNMLGQTSNYNKNDSRYY